MTREVSDAKIRVLIVDDSSVIRTLYTKIPCLSEKRM